MTATETSRSPRTLESPCQSQNLNFDPLDFLEDFPGSSTSSVQRGERDADRQEVTDWMTRVSAEGGTNRSSQQKWSLVLEDGVMSSLRRIA